MNYWTRKREGLSNRNGMECKDGKDHDKVMSRKEERMMREQN